MRESRTSSETSRPAGMVKENIYRWDWENNRVIPAVDMPHEEWKTHVREAKAWLKKTQPRRGLGKVQLRVTFLGWEAGLDDRGAPRVFAVGVFEGDELVAIRYASSRELQSTLNAMAQPLVETIAKRYGKLGIAWSLFAVTAKIGMRRVLRALGLGKPTP